MRIVAALYMAAALAANGAAAQEAAPPAQPGIAALRTGDMQKLVVHEAPQPVPDTPFEGEGGEAMTLQDLRGRVTVVNFWATWCAPCREEMPTLAALQAAMGDDVAVVPIAVGRNDPVEMERFMAEAGADALPLARDPRQALARDMGVLGLPVTVILDRDGQEVARLQGDANWNGDSAQAIVRALAGE